MVARHPVSPKGKRSQINAGQAKMTDFSTITETPRSRATAEQLRILYRRYLLAAELVGGKDVLEVACGAGVGLGLLSRRARSVTGIDIDENNCRTARETYECEPRVTVERADATCLPFRDGSFDVVVVFEALYYLPSVEAFLWEVDRVLRPQGLLIVSTVNCSWSGFNRSPFSTKYYSADELSGVLVEHGYRSRMFAGFPVRTEGLVRRVVHRIRMIGVKLHLVPKTMKGKEVLKRLFYGRLAPIPGDLREGAATVETLIALGEITDLDKYKMIYAVAEKQ